MKVGSVTLAELTDTEEKGPLPLDSALPFSITATQHVREAKLNLRDPNRAISFHWSDQAWISNYWGN